jgi:hypothetical protein
MNKYYMAILIMVELTMSKINTTKLFLKNYFRVKTIVAKLKMINLTMNKVNMAKLTNE